MKEHTVEKIGGTSMSDFEAVRDNVVLGNRSPEELYQRIFVVSAYGGITNMLLEHKKSGKPGVYALFANEEEEESGCWREALDQVAEEMLAINDRMLDGEALKQANQFTRKRIEDARRCLNDLERVCSYGHFQLEEHLLTVREMLSCIGEAHSAWNTTLYLQEAGVNAVFVDLSGWRSSDPQSLDDHIREALADIDLATQLPIVTGYAHCAGGLMHRFDRGYSEMTFSRMAVVTEAREAVIHKEFHLSSADPRVVGEDKVVPIGRTNYDVADQLSNLGMEAIHPHAAKGLRENGIPLRVKNTFEPEHSGTLITEGYVSESPCVEIIAGRKAVFAIEVFDQDMVGEAHGHDRQILENLKRFRAKVVSKDINANTITHFVAANLKIVKRITRELSEIWPNASISTRRVSVVSAIGSDMQVPGILAKAVSALADSQINVLALHQSMRQVDMQFIVDEADYAPAIRSLHKALIEPYDHGYAICAA